MSSFLERNKAQVSQICEGDKYPTISAALTAVSMCISSMSPTTAFSVVKEVLHSEVTVIRSGEILGRHASLPRLDFGQMQVSLGSQHRRKSASASFGFLQSPGKMAKMTTHRMSHKE